MSDPAADWAESVEAIATKRSLTYDAVGGLNPANGPAALCPGGSNRLTGQITPEYWGASCDAEERGEGGFLRKVAMPGAVLCKAHVPDLADVMPPFNVESLERTAEDIVERRVSRNRVQFESIDFNKRFLATVPSEYDPVALRETFSPGFLDWCANIDANIDFGVSEQQLYFLWRFGERSAAEYARGLDNAGELFRRIRNEIEEHGVHTYPAGPWHAGLAPFPDQPPAGPMAVPGA